MARLADCCHGYAPDLPGFHGSELPSDLDVGHWVQAEAPDEVASRIRALLAR